tara:strand:- start:160 stop:411 length:252 start_codon:yes stop_codon:yes gene_type:complete
MHALLISTTGDVLASASTKHTQHFKKTGVGSNKTAAHELGQLIAKKIKEHNMLDSVAFDRNGYLYHGRVAAVAVGAREAGVKF